MTALAAIPVPGRFWDKVRLEGDGCMTWTAARDEKGYALFQKPGHEGRGTIRAHLWLWRHVRGTVLDGLELDHVCGNRACVNLEHLEAVTHRVNTLRGGNPCAVNARKTACKHGHELTLDPWHPGQRRCLTCKRLASRKYRLRKKGEA